jgi:heme/copper-type cytochrome/quinol oxidase subunit 3
MTDFSVPQSMEATDALSAGRVDRTRLVRPNGWWGIAVFVASEATLFGTLFGTYFYLRFQNAHWPPPGIEPPPITLPLVLAGVLVLTSIPLQLGLAAARAGRVGVTRAALLLALVVQAGYFGMQIHLFIHDVHKFAPQGSSYASIYFTLVGAHHFHVLVGILLNAWLLLRFATGMTIYRVVGLQSVTFYWHFVNVLAMIVTTVQLYPSL